MNLRFSDSYHNNGVMKIPRVRRRGFLWSPKNKYNSRVTSLIRYKEHQKHPSSLIIRRAGEELSPRDMPMGAFF